MRVTQRDDLGDIIMEHSFPIAEECSHLDYSIVDDYMPDAHTPELYANLTDHIFK